MDAVRCTKTEAGRAEIRARALPLSRTARNLLVIIDPSRTAQEWLTLVQGATEADLAMLLDHGLVASSAAAGAGAAGGATAAAHRPAAAAPREADAVAGTAAAMDALSYDQLYELLTTQAKERFGLIKGYRLVLDVEKCANLAELQALGHRFAAQVKDEHGEAGLRALRMALGLRS
jgi:hypothetical protein